MAAESALRVAVWGLGGHARRTAVPALQAARGIEIVGVWTRDAAVRAEVAADLDVTAYASDEALLSDTRVDVVYLATPVGLHHEQGGRILAAGKHLWCEKSLTGSLDEAHDLIAQAERADLALCETVMFLHHPQVATVQALIDAGRLGRVRTIRARFGFPHLDPSNIRYAADLGGGALNDAGCYPLSAALALGHGAPTEVHARLGSDGEHAVDTEGWAQLVWSDGLVAQLEWGFGRAYRNEIEIWGEGGILSVERAFSKPATLATTLTLTPQPGTPEGIAVAAADQFALMFERFAGDLRSAEGRAHWWTDARQRAALMAAVRGQA